MASEMNEGFGYDAEDYDDFEDVEDVEDMEDDDDEMFEDDDDEAIDAFDGLEADDDDDEEVFGEDDDDDEDVESDDDDEVYAEGDWEGDWEDDDDETSETDDDDEVFEADDEVYAEGVLEDEDDEDIEDYDIGFAGMGETETAAELSRRARRRRRARARKRARWLARRRAAARRRRLLAQRRRASQRARTLRRKLFGRLRRIRRPGRRIRVRKIRKLKGSGVVTARLPNGRVTKMMITPPPATLGSVNRLTRQISANDAKQAKAIRLQSTSISRLKSAQRAAVKSLTAQQAKSSKDLAKRIATGDSRLDKRISKETRVLKTAHSRHRTKMLRSLRQQRKRSLWNAILVGSSLPLYAAYGKKSDPFAANNLILTGSLAFWLLGDDLMSRFLGGKNWRRTSDIWSYLAPVGNAAFAWWYFKDKQHERFITGTTKLVTLRGVGPTKVDVGSDYEKEFDKLDDPPVLATITDVQHELGSPPAKRDLHVVAKVTGGKLTLSIEGEDVGDTTTATVHWAVDTKQKTTTS